MKNITVVLMLVCVVNLLRPANALAEQLSVLFLKNGSVIKGQLVEIDPAKQVKIQTYDGSIFVYPIAEVEKIEQATSQRKQMQEDVSQIETSRKQANLESEKSDVIELRGPFVQGSIGTSTIGDGAIAGVNAGYTSPFGGIGMNFSMGYSKISDDDFDYIEGTSLGIGIGGHMGYQFDKIRPRLNLGFGYSIYDDQISDISLSVVSVSSGLGIDFVTNSRIIFSLGLVSVYGIIGGSFEGSKPNGIGFGVFDNFSVGYLF